MNTKTSVMRYLYSYHVEVFSFLILISTITGCLMHILNYKIEEALNNNFTICMIEFPGSSEFFKNILIDIKNKGACDYLYKNLLIDFAFMPAIYGLVSLWLWMQSLNRTQGWKQLLRLFIILQVAAWGLDITENLMILSALADPNSPLTTTVTLLKFIVPAKFSFVFGGIILGLIVAARKPINNIKPMTVFITNLTI